MMQQSPNDIWMQILSELGDIARDDIFLKQTKPITLTESQFTVSVPALFTQEQIHDRFLTSINEYLEEFVGTGCRLNITVVQPGNNSTPGFSSAAAATSVLPAKETRLDPKCTFDRFVVGASNRLSHAAALGCAKEPGDKHNPLFIHGGVGLGKTHLLHAVGNYIQAHHSHLKVLYVTSEIFMNEYIDSISARTTAQDFRNKYRTANVLLIDDIQFLRGKEGTQEEFFHTFNELHLNSNQIVMTSDRPPRNLETVEERLTSRFGCGMVADIDPPQFETRLAILRQKCEDYGYENINDSVLSYIAEVVQTNIRDLEGKLNRLVMESSVCEEELTVEFAARVLGPLSTQSPVVHHRAITVDDIQEAVANYFELKISDLKSSKRNRAYVYPRQISMYLCRELTSMSLQEIAAAFNKQDHTTVIHACEKIQERIPVDTKLEQDIKLLIADIQ